MPSYINMCYYLTERSMMLEQNFLIKLYSKGAFTLAEVIITIGILGVISALTIPALVNNYNAKVWNTSSQMFSRKLDEAVKVMNTQRTLAGHESTESFVEELSKHFRISKICDSSEIINCFPHMLYWGTLDAEPRIIDVTGFDNAMHLGHDDWQTNLLGVQFASGVVALIAYNPLCEENPYDSQYVGGNCYAILYDTNGFKLPNTSAKDLRANSSVTRLGNGCIVEIGEICFTTLPVAPSAHVWNACKSDGTSDDSQDQEYMAKYGIKCATGNDYFAGAVEMCGGKDKLPTQQQLVDLAKYIYNVDSISFSGTSTGLTLDRTKVENMGFSLDNAGGFWLLSGEEPYSRHFGVNSTVRYGHRVYARAAACIK